MMEAFEDVMKDKKIGLVRAVSGFYKEELISYLESKHINCIIMVRIYPIEKNAIGGLADWIELSPGIQ
jgi:hypothetical protein